MITTSALDSSVMTRLRSDSATIAIVILSR
jgi:hypothetical protein